VVDRDFLVAAADLIDTAAGTLCLAQLEYLYENRRVGVITDALAAAVARGVAVKVLLDDSVAFNADAVPLLRQRGIDARLDDAGRLTHAKLMVADGARALVTSANLSGSAIAFNHEAGLLVVDPPVAAAFGRHCDALHAAPRRLHRITFADDGTALLVPLGDGGYVAPALAMLAAARRRVDIVLYAMRYYADFPDGPSTRLVDALIAAARRGVMVRVLLEESDFDADLNAANDLTSELLRRAGVAARRDAADVITHAKVFVADDVAIIGSSNWSFGALAEDHQADVLVRDAALVAGLRAYAEERFAEGR
jgi:phosphatidylserine/phosphatidylglycerophosphate/cardiolipin synthase-like enzyme